jgi:DNA-directed RNA polymerase specialized sigma24 family protein
MLIPLEAIMTGKTDEASETPTRLDEIPTRWSLLRLAHRATLSTAQEARNALVLRYARAIRNYVGALIRCEQDADEVAQEVVVRLLRGQFAAADPHKGSFRRLLMVAAHNLVRTYWAKQRRQPLGDIDLEGVAHEPEELALEEECLANWKKAVLELAWKALEEYQLSHPGSIACTVLRLRAQYPDDDSETLARRLGEKLGKPFSADALRQQLRRARVRFAQGLIEEVASGLNEPTPSRVEEELIEAGLMPYVRDFLPPDWRTSGELVNE